MSYTTLLIDTCTVSRNTPGAAGNYGTPAASWADVAALTDIACRLVPAGGREVKVGIEVVVADYKLFLGDITLTEQDKIVIGSDTYDILLVEDRQNGIGSHHKECLLRTVR